MCCTDVRDEGHRSPLHLACLGGHKDVAQYLVEKANCDVSEWINFVNGIHIPSLTKCLRTHISLRYERQKQPDSTAQELW